MHLHREPVVGVDDFEQQRELFAIFVEHAFPNQVAHESFYQVVDFVALKVAVGHFALLVPKARKQPHLAAIGQRTKVQPKLLLDFAPAPDFVLENGLEFKWIKYRLHFS